MVEIFDKKDVKPGDVVFTIGTFDISLQIHNGQNEVGEKQTGFSVSAQLPGYSHAFKRINNGEELEEKEKINSNELLFAFLQLENDHIHAKTEEEKQKIEKELYNLSDLLFWGAADIISALNGEFKDVVESHEKNLETLLLVEKGKISISDKDLEQKDEFCYEEWETIMGEVKKLLEPFGIYRFIEKWYLDIPDPEQ